MTHEGNINADVSCHTYEWGMKYTGVMLHIWMRDEIHRGHVTHMSEQWNTQGSCHTYEWVMKYTWVMSHTWPPRMPVSTENATSSKSTKSSFSIWWISKMLHVVSIWCFLVSTENANILEIHQIEKLRSAFLNLVDFSVSRGTNLNWDLGWTWIFTEEVDPRNPPNRETLTSWYLAVQIYFEIVVECEFVQGGEDP